MTKCNLIYHSLDNPHFAERFLNLNDYEIVFNDETEYVFVINSNTYSELCAWRIGVACGAGKKIVVLCQNEEDCYVVNWLMESACMAVDIKTGKELDMIEI